MAAQPPPPPPPPPPAASFQTLDPGTARQTHLRSIGWTPPAERGPRPLVAVLDTGVDASAPDLAGVVVARQARSFVPESRDPLSDPSGHGTHVAGLIAADGDNGIGGAGVARARILPITIAAPDGVTTSAALVRGLRYASARGAKVINISFGGRGFSAAEQRAIDDAVRKGALVVAAAGNTGTEGGGPDYPGAYRQVLAVAALGRDGRPLRISARGPQLALSAPGDRLLATAAGGPGGQGGDGLVARTGTSMAAAVVSGAAARLWAADPRLTAQQVRSLLETTARDIPPAGPDAASGLGALDLGAALKAPTPPREDREPNDDPRLAALLPPLLTAREGSRLVRGRVGSWADPRDGYRLALRAGQRLRISLRGPARADLDLVVWLPGTPGGARGARFGRTWLAAASLKPTSRESIAYTASATGTYTVEVQGLRGPAYYHLRATRS